MEVLIDGRIYVPYKQRSSHCLNERQWEALAAAEKPIYQFGDLGITDTSERKECDIAADVWSYVELAMDAMDQGDGLQMTKIAHRVARVFGLMAFGPDFLLR